MIFKPNSSALKMSLCSYLAMIDGSIVIFYTSTSTGSILWDSPLIVLRQRVSSVDDASHLTYRSQYLTSNIFSLPFLWCCIHLSRHSWSSVPWTTQAARLIQFYHTFPCSFSRTLQKCSLLLTFHFFLNILKFNIEASMPDLL
jgi:hypothetical protein